MIHHMQPSARFMQYADGQRTMRSSDARNSFSALANSDLYCSSSGLSGLGTGAALSFAGAAPALDVPMATALGVPTSAIVTNNVRLSQCKLCISTL